MAEPLKHINYSFEDIQRYLHGKMSAAEMHDIERAALQDPFLADAIEGFTQADFSIAKQHLIEINASFFAEKQKTKVVAFNKRTQWLNVAALIVVLAGIGLIASYFLKTKSSNKQIEIAKVQREPVKDETAKDSTSMPASSNALIKQPDSTLLIAESKAVKKTQLLSAKRKLKENVVVDNSDLNKIEANTNNQEIATIAAAPPEDEKTMKTRSLIVTDTPFQLQGKVSGLPVLPSPATFAGKVVDENNKPIAGVTIASDDKKTAVLTDINGNFNLQKTDTLLKVTASTVGYDSQTMALKRGANNPMVLKQTDLALKDVVVVGYGTRRERNAYTDSITSTEEKTIGGSAMPVGGWNSFNNYVLMQLNKDTTTSSLPDSKDLVELEFLIDKAGNPYDIRVTKSPNETQSSKATEILKNGPKWTSPSKKKKAKVIINF